jgi:hypothetical protein
MPSPPEVEPGRLPRMPGYSAAVRSALVFCAFAVTLLPIPLTYLGILPAYRVHAWFLLFYAPFLCLLTLCYLFYVRDSLARAMFADVLNPPPPADPYYREPLGDRLKRGFRRFKGILLGILPALLVITSMYSVSRYLASMDESVALATERYVERSAASREVGAVAEDRERPARRRSVEPSRPGKHPPAPTGDVAPDSLPPPWDAVAVREYVLRTTGIDDIPRLVELTVLFMGTFVALLIAVTLMALKEYAKEALGLSEHELMFGRYYRSAADE